MHENAADVSPAADRSQSRCVDDGRQIAPHALSAAVAARSVATSSRSRLRAAMTDLFLGDFSSRVVRDGVASILHIFRSGGKTSC
jgi:hypothetical protein